MVCNYSSVLYFQWQLSLAKQRLTSEQIWVINKKYMSSIIHVQVSVTRRHLHYIWNTNMADWFHLGNKSLQDILCLTSLARINSLPWENHINVFLINWQEHKHSNNCLIQIGNIHKQSYRKLGIRLLIHRELFYRGECVLILFNNINPWHQKKNKPTSVLKCNDVV